MKKLLQSLIIFFSLTASNSSFAEYNSLKLGEGAGGYLIINDLSEKINNSVCGYATNKSHSFDEALDEIFLYLNDNDKIKALNEMRRVSRNKVVIYEPYRNNPFNFLFGLIVKEERESLKFSKTYLKTLFMKSGMDIVNMRIEGCILPNKAPKFCIPIGKYLEKTFFRNLGFYIRATVLA